MRNNCITETILFISFTTMKFNYTANRRCVAKTYIIRMKRSPWRSIWINSFSSRFRVAYSIAMTWASLTSKGRHANVKVICSRQKYTDCISSEYQITKREDAKFNTNPLKIARLS